MTKDKIIAAALALFAKNGYEGTSLSEIAKAVGIQKPSIYNHFKSKEEIFFTIYENILWFHVHKVEKLIEDIKGLNAKEQLFQILDLTFQYYIDYEEQSTFLNRAVFFPPENLKEQLHEQFMVSEEAMSAILRTVINKGMENGEIRKGNIDDFIISYYCLIDGIFIELSYYGVEKMKPRILNIWTNFWFGLKND
ncbi:TetR/AcrR family transcriptional regulator [Neobacillus ginsengisoli]|uniref:AcrR family transcriptional regulator n=1 Tax=Neobacillus ginsengisoli TaxID=904295 RepID=A0ABT9XT74_9BACI|nr:TetR/AcrR family transcriptional regulator [Neobacillus ginsengisoli]MDQ0198729.1 AcrR family transcriptional regulator [Neobacillus ginsengisoli]